MRQLLFSILVCISVYTNAQVSVIGTSTPSNDWTTDHDMVETSPGSGIWKTTIELTTGAIKIRKNHVWTPYWGGSFYPEGIATLNGSDILIPNYNKYHIIFNENTLTCSIYPSISIIGPATEANNWTTDIYLFQNGTGSNEWSTLVELNIGDLKFRQDGSWDINWGNTPFPSGTAILNGPNIIIPIKKYAQITFNTSTLAYQFNYSFCSNTIKFPSSTFTVSNGLNTITNDQISGQYNVTSGYQDFSTCTFNSSNPDDFITLIDDSNFEIASGYSPLQLEYHTVNGRIQMHINSDVFCAEDQALRTTSVFVQQPCDNSLQNSNMSFNVQCGSNTISNVMLPGSFEVTTINQNLAVLTFDSDQSPSYITLRKTSNNEVVAHGLSPLKFTYLSTMGDIEVHLNTDEACGTSTNSRTLTVFNQCPCDNGFQYPAQIQNANCGINNITDSQFAGDFNITTGYSNGNLAIFSSSNASDFITLRKNSDNTVLQTGQTPLFLIYEGSMGNIEMHVNIDESCGTNSTSRSTFVDRKCGCYNNLNFLGDYSSCTNSISVATADCFFNYNFQFDGEFFIESANTNDFFTITKHDGSIVSFGQSPISFNYNSSMGFLVVYINSGASCSQSTDLRDIFISSLSGCPDMDNDGINDYVDNCPEVANPSQNDYDFDSIGDLCDTDFISTENIGIGTANPKQKLHIKDGNLFIDNNLRGLILKSDDGRCWLSKVEITEDPITFEEVAQIKLIQVDCPE